MKKVLYILLFSCAILAANPLYSFKNVSINYLNWTSKTKEKTSQRDFAYLSLNGGFGYEWMDFYGFLTLENPTKPYDNNFPENKRYVGYGDLDIAIKDNFKLHIQDFYANGRDFSVNDLVLGLSYKYFNDGFWIKPFLGVHFTNDTYFDGFNGYMTGWVFNYPFTIYKGAFSIFQWNEIEFGRVKSFYQFSGTPVGDGKSYGLNGSLSFWWHINNDFSTGIEYRYADHKLGNIDYQSGYIYTVKYNF